MINKKINMVVLPIFSSLLFSCMTVSSHSDALNSKKDREMTVGVVQKEIRKGMTQSDVIAVLGSPNIVTRDSTGKETWVYDKIASEASYSKDNGFIFLILGGYSKQGEAISTTQKTLTVIIKFDENGKVESFSYHSSKF